MKSKRKTSPSRDKLVKEVIKRLDGQLTDEDYLQYNGLRCPRCQSPEPALSTSVEPLASPGRPFITFNDNSTKARRLIRCGDCEFTYWDLYELAGFAEYQDGDETVEQF